MDFLKLMKSVGTDEFDVKITIVCCKQFWRNPGLGRLVTALESKPPAWSAANKALFLYTLGVVHPKPPSVWEVPFSLCSPWLKDQTQGINVSKKKGMDGRPTFPVSEMLRSFFLCVKYCIFTRQC